MNTIENIAITLIFLAYLMYRIVTGKRKIRK